MGGTINPVSPSRTSVARSPVSVETTGSPAANASSTETGWLSITEELRKMSALSHRRGIASGSTRPTNRIPATRKEAASWRSRLSSLPDPATVRVASG